MEIAVRYNDIINALDNISLQGRTRKDISNNFTYNIQNVNELRQHLLTIQDIPYLEPQLQTILYSVLFRTTLDEISISRQEYLTLNSEIGALRIKLQVLKDIAEHDTTIMAEDILSVRVPSLNSFDALGKFATDLKRSIEIPIIDSGIDSNIEIIGAGKGSVILYISVGGLLTINLIGGICWSAAVIRRKMAEAKIFEEHARTLKLKNDSLQNLVEAQNTQIKNILQAEAEAIAAKHYTASDPETIERLKLSINTVSDLIDKGVKIMPQTGNEDIRKSFPDYSQLNLIESTIKQLRNSGIS